MILSLPRLPSSSFEAAVEPAIVLPASALVGIPKKTSAAAITEFAGGGRLNGRYTHGRPD